MNIQDAILQAKEKGRGITRTSWGTRTPMIIPTNTTARLIWIDFKDNSKLRWQPSADDLIADDWIVYG